ncbi:MAG: SUMF1/EgtB/PvdO family nonheme iron enzyme [Propionibacteriaceae bacterium]|nr:SUMF1/EgtB/PvdO family nonheme iron enzyme [Propionibacteriaceae bacterium]
MSFDPLVPRAIDLPRPWAPAAPLSDLDDGKILAAPSDRAQWPAFRERITAWRDDARARLDYDDALYHQAESAWAATCFTVAQVWLWDELLYDFEHAVFTPEKLVADFERFGGIDAVVLWHAYPIIGIDERNQWDWYRDVPGIVELVAHLRRLGLRVFIDYNPWDTGTRRGRDDRTELAELVAHLDVDGIFLDTLREAGPELIDRLQRAKPGVALEGESKLALERISDHHLSWAQWFADSPVPGVLKARWFERRHMQHHIRRWHRDYSGELVSAWLNGAGVMVWENVFSAWVGWNARDAATLARMVTWQRALADVLVRGEWTPLVDVGPDLVAGEFVLGSTRLLAVANPHDRDHAMTVPGADASITTLDLCTGQLATGQVSVPSHSIGGLVQVRGPVPAGLATAAAWVAEHPHNPDAAFPYRETVRLHAGTMPTGPRIPGEGVVVHSGRHRLTVRYRMRETGIYAEAPFVDEWKPLEPRLHDLRTLERVANLATDVRVSDEITADQFWSFVQQSGYEPRCAQGFEPGPGTGPATGVDLSDARAYASWVRGRLPTEDEWQLAAGAPGWRRTRPGVWNWTESEHSDGRSRWVILKGGSDHHAEGSDWYVEPGIQSPDFSCKFLLPGFGLARSPWIGFRTAWDEESPT